MADRFAHARGWFLKGFLALNDRAIPRTHNLEELVRLCQSVEANVDFGSVDATELTPFAVEIRYDFEFWPSLATGQEALDLALEIRRAILAAVPPEAKP